MNRARPYLNRFVKRKEQQIEDSYHSANMREIKPITSKLMDHTETIMINKSKGDMIKEVRDIEIERENKVLLQKISSVMSKKGSYSMSKTRNIRTKVNNSLNQFYRKRQLQEIESQNKRFVQRLQQKKPTMNIQKLNRDWLDNKSVIKRMSNHEFNLTSIKSSSRVRSTTIQKLYKSKYDKIKFSKIKVIDGFKMLIKVEFTEELLKIIGDSQNNKDLKIIQIPKEEAVIFIEKDCRGQVENIVDKLKYDGQTGTLYLVSDHLEEGDPDFSDFNPEIQKITAYKNEKKKSSLQNKSTLESKHPHKKEKKETHQSIVEPQNPIIPMVEEKRKETEKKESSCQIEEPPQNNQLKRVPAIQFENKPQEEPTEKSKQQQVHHKDNEKKKEAEPERVVQKLEEAIQPQEITYQQEKFQQSNHLAESKQKSQPKPVHEEVLEPQTAHQEIIVAPVEEQNYNQEFQASGVEIKKVAQEHKQNS